MMVIKFKKGGAVEMIPTGYAGEACRRVTSFYGRKMAGDVVKDVDTAEAGVPEENYVPATKKANKA